MDGQEAHLGGPGDWPAVRQTFRRRRGVRSLESGFEKLVDGIAPRRLASVLVNRLGLQVRHMRVALHSVDRPGRDPELTKQHDRIDPIDGSSTLVGNIGLNSAFGLAFNPFNELMYVTDAEKDSLYIIDPDSAELQFVGGPYSLSEYGTGLSFSNPIPEPCTLMLLGLGAVMVCRKR